MKPAASWGRRSGRMAVLAIVGLFWPALGLAEAWPHAKPSPAPRSGEPGQPRRPSYGKWSPGQVLPPDAGAEVIADYQRFHLRRPPRGYAWMQRDGDFILVNAAGLIFEVIPGDGR